MSGKVLVVASHPDDELLGLGGTLKKLINDGCEVVTVLTSKGRKEEEERVGRSIAAANAALGVKEVLFMQYPNLRLGTYPLHDIVKEIEAVIGKHDPDIVFTHHYGDINEDHQVTFRAVLTATRPLPDRKPRELLCFETVSSSEWTPHTDDKTFKPNFFVDITDTFADKLQALRHYDVEMRPFPHPRSYEGVEYMARVRGMTVGVHYAEAFEMIRKVWK